MPIFIEGSPSYQFTKGEPLSAAALNAIGSPIISADLFQLDESDVNQVKPSKLKPIRGRKLKRVELENLPAGEKGDILYFDPESETWKRLTAGGDYNVLTPKGWLDKIAAENLIERQSQVRTGFAPQISERKIESGKGSISAASKPVDFSIELPAGVYVSTLQSLVVFDIRVEDFSARIGSEELTWFGPRQIGTQTYVYNFSGRATHGILKRTIMKMTHHGGVLEIKPTRPPLETNKHFDVYDYYLSADDTFINRNKMPPDFGFALRTIRYSDSNPE